MTTEGSKKKAIVVLSGGLDSLVALAWALDAGYWVEPLFVNYGQRSVLREQVAATSIVHHYMGKTEDISRLVSCSVSSNLWSVSGYTPSLVLGDPDSVCSAGKRGLSAEIPGRNLVIASMAASRADEGDTIIFGFIKPYDDEDQYVDASAGFLTAMQNVAVNSINNVSEHGILLFAPLKDFNKTEVLQLGLSLKAPIELAYSCWTGWMDPCNKCVPCRNRFRALRENGYE